jgi:hypothetical protein
MLDQFRIEALESNNEAIVIRAEDGAIRVTAKIPCDILDKSAANPVHAFTDRIDLAGRNLETLAAIVRKKFRAGQFRSYHGIDGLDRWIVFERGDLCGLRLR